MPTISALESAGIDLTTWKAAYCGGEAMAPNTLRSFGKRFEKNGFSSDRFLPLYGMSEATLLVSGHLPHTFPLTEHINGREIISCGKIIDELEVAIVDPETLAPVPDGTPGEIWASGPGISLGYIGDPEKNAATFGLAIKGREGRYLRTGDLGVLKNSELYIVGRLKEVFILQGRKFHAQDIESSIKEAVPQLQLAPFLLVSIKEASRECLHLLLEIPEVAIPLVNQAAPMLAKLLAQKHEVPLGDIWIIEQGGLPRTDVGKTQRFKAQQMAQDEKLPFIQKIKTNSVKASAPVAAMASEARAPQSSAELKSSNDAIAHEISKMIAAELGADHVDLQQPFVELGLSSLTVYSLSGALEKTFKLTIAPTIFYDFPNIDSLTRHIHGELHPESKSVDQRLERKDFQNGESEDIAIVGYACRLPGADNAQDFWQNLKEGVCSIGEVPTERWSKSKYYAPLPAQIGKMYVNRGGFTLQSVKNFDPQHFGITPTEAVRIDPQQRLMLELCWEAMDHSGTYPRPLARLPYWCLGRH